MEVRNSIEKLLDSDNNLIILDDFHLYDSKIIPFDFLIKLYRICSKKKIKNNQLLILQTKLAETRKIAQWSDNISIIKDNEYLEYWEPEWLNQFVNWFKALSFTPIITKYRVDFIEQAKESKNPWSFVSVIVDLKMILEDQFLLPRDADLFFLLTLITWSFCVSNEIGISPIELYNGLCWVKEKRKDLWNNLIKKGGRLWDYVNKKQEDPFLEIIIKQINEWRAQPKNSLIIRLLPSEGGILGNNTPIKSHHTAWWNYALKSLWETNKILKDWSELKDILELIIVHGCSTIIGHYLNIDKNCSILQNCTQIEYLDLSINKVKDISPLSSCKNLQKLILSNTQVEDVSPLNSCNNLQELILSNTQVEDVSPLNSYKNLQILYLYGTKVEDVSPLSLCKSLQILDLSFTQVEDVSPLSSCENLQELNLCRTQVKDVSPLNSNKKLKISK